jgi:hypothetical protein
MYRNLRSASSQFTNNIQRTIKYTSNVVRPRANSLEDCDHHEGMPNMQWRTLVILSRRHHLDRGPGPLA